MEPKTKLSRGISAENGLPWYRITVCGLVPQRWVGRLGELRITEASRGRSTLEGPIVDPAAMAGVLDTLCQLGLPILEVVALNMEK